MDAGRKCARCFGAGGWWNVGGVPRLGGPWEDCPRCHGTGDEQITFDECLTLAERLADEVEQSIGSLEIAMLGSGHDDDCLCGVHVAMRNLVTARAEARQAMAAW